MRELTARLRFTRPSLGNVKGNTAFRFHRNPSGQVVFLATWHHSNLRFAAKILGRHHDEVGKVLWDTSVDGVVRPDGWYKRYYAANGNGRQRFAVHEAFLPGQVVGVNCVVPEGIPDEDFWHLVEIAGRYKGLSPARPTEFGHYEVETIRPRRPKYQTTDLPAAAGTS